MRLTRIFVPGELAADSEILLPAQSGEHLTRVLRLESGAPLTIFNGQGGEYSAVLGAHGGRKVPGMPGASRRRRARVAAGNHAAAGRGARRAHGS
jgi:16S rRNA (uracil1498-N3)-methyltransferase